MSEILTSLHGRRLGLDADGALVCPGGFVAGNNGSQVFMPSPQKVVTFDDFLGDVVADQWNFVEGSGTGATGAISAAIGGVFLLTSDDTAGSMAADGCLINSGALNWQASNGGLAFEARVALSSIASVCVFLGFTDVTTLEMPIQSAGSANTLTSNASDAVGVMFDTSMTDDNWWLVGVDTDVDATHQDSGIAPVAATFETWRVEVAADGSARFFNNGIQVGTRMTGAVTPATDLTPVIAVFPRTTAIKTVSIDYIYAQMNR